MTYWLFNESKSCRVLQQIEAVCKAAHNYKKVGACFNLSSTYCIRATASSCRLECVQDCLALPTVMNRRAFRGQHATNITMMQGGGTIYPADSRPSAPLTLDRGFAAAHRP